MTHLFIRFAHLYGWFPKLVSLVTNTRKIIQINPKSNTHILNQCKKGGTNHNYKTTVVPVTICNS